MAKKTTTKQNELRMNMQTEISTEELTDAGIDALLLGEMIEAAPKEEIVEPVVAIESNIEAIAAPEVEADAPIVKKAKKEKVAKEKVEKEPRMSYVGHKVSEVLADRLGGDIANNVLLEISDVSLDTTALQEKQAALLALLDVSPAKAASSKMGDVPTTQIKTAQKAVQLFTWIKNNGVGKMNEVVQRAFTVLARDGELTTGPKGNLYENLLSKPYSPGTCSAQSTQIFELFSLLKIVNKVEKGRYSLNPNSLIFAKAKAELAL